MQETLFEVLERHQPAHFVTWVHPRSQLRAILVLDELSLGPAAGGVRTWRYGRMRDALEDACRLARAMTIKCALAGIHAGGGKVVVLDHADLKREPAFEELGRRIQDLGGIFRTAGDVGTTKTDLDAMARCTRFVHTDEDNLADAVARGLLACADGVAEVHGKPLGETKVAVQGCGSIGTAVARALAARGAKLVVADLHAARARALADALGAETATPEAILTSDVDIVAPCALGDVIDEPVASEIRAWAVCGAANNILADARAGARLHERGILMVPDTIASAGAVVEGIGRTVMGLGDRSALIEGLGTTAREVLATARESGRTPDEVALERAERILAKAREVTRH